MVQFSNDKIQQLRSESKSDPVLSSLQDIIVNGWPNRRDKIPKQLRLYWSYRDELSVEDGVILRGEQVLIPKSIQADVVQRVHAGHQGIEKCKLRAKSCVYWNGINNDIEEVVKRYETYQEHQRSYATETLIPHELPTRAWQILGTDLFHFDNKEYQYYLIVADYYSKFPFIRKMPTPCTSHAVVTATADIFSEHGSPEKVVSDNGGHYDCANYRNFADYRNFAESWGFEHVTSSPHNPQSNGFIERSIQTVKRTLMKAKESNMDPCKAMLCLRSTPIDYHLPSPSELLHVRKLKGDLPIQIRNPLTCRDEIQSRLSERQDTQTAYHDTHAHNWRPLEAGQPVRIQDHVSGRWKKATVKERCEERSYLVESQSGNTLRRNRKHHQRDDLCDSPTIL